jgi:hypothetical protein
LLLLLLKELLTERAAFGVDLRWCAKGSRRRAATPWRAPAPGDAAPEIRQTRDRESETPTGPPPKPPEAMQAHPCAPSSRFGPHFLLFSAWNAEQTETTWSKSTQAKVKADRAKLRNEPSKQRSTMRCQIAGSNAPKLMSDLKAAAILAKSRKAGDLPKQQLEK